jgi:TM2 domain-containing membrane protein YozV
LKESYCSACGKNFLKGELTIWCRLCLQLYHASCWEKAAGCTTPGCTGKPALKDDSKPVQYKKCIYCGEDIIEFASRCRYCRSALPEADDKKDEPQKVVNRFDEVPRKDPILACLLNLIFPGAGYMYLGQTGRGLFWFLIFCAAVYLTRSYLVPLAIWLWVMYDSSKQARIFNCKTKAYNDRRSG